MDGQSHDAYLVHESFRPYVEEYDGNASLISDDFVCPKSDDAQEMTNDDNALL